MRQRESGKCELSSIVSALCSASRIRFAWLCITVASLLTSGLTQSEVHAAQVTLRWDYSCLGSSRFRALLRPLEPQLPHAYRRRQHRHLHHRHAAGGATSFCAVTAYDSAKVESDYSNELSVTVPPAAPAVNFSASPAQRHCAAHRRVHQHDHRAGHELGVELRRRNHAARRRTRPTSTPPQAATSLSSPRPDPAVREQDGSHGDQRGTTATATAQARSRTLRRSAWLRRTASARVAAAPLPTSLATTTRARSPAG